MDPARNVEVPCIAYFAGSIHPSQYPTGVTTYVNTMRQELKTRGVRVRVLTRHAEKDDLDAVLLPQSGFVGRALRPLNGIRTGLGYRLYRRIVLAWAALALERRERVAVFEIEEHAGMADLLLRVPLRAAVVLRLHGPHFLVAGSNGTPWDREARANDAAEKSCAVRAIAVSAPSQHVLQQVRNHWELELPGAAVIPNPTRVAPKAERWMGCRDGPILFVGRFDRTKGADLVVRAFRDLAQRFPRHELWLVGPERSLHDGGRVYGVADFLAAELPDLSLRSRVKFLGERTPLEIADYRRRCSCVVVASRFETFCMTATEAMMAGCPLVASDAGALPEIVEDGATGLLFRSGEPLDLSRMIERFLLEEPLAHRLGEAGYRAARERYAPEKIAGRMLDLYQSVSRTYSVSTQASRSTQGGHPS